MRRALLTPLVLVAVAGCGTVQEASDGAGKVQDCAGLARDALASGLSGVPSAAQAEEAVQRLDDRIGDLGDTTVRDAAQGLRDRLQEVVDAARSADPARVQQAAADARDAAAEAARACSLPVDAFTG